MEERHAEVQARDAARDAPRLWRRGAPNGASVAAADRVHETADRASVAPGGGSRQLTGPCLQACLLC